MFPNVGTSEAETTSMPALGDTAPPMESQTQAVKTDQAQRETARKTQDERRKKQNHVP